MLNFLIAPDFAPQRFISWYRLNTLLQKNTQLGSHLLMPASAKEQANLIKNGNIDILYANPFDAAHLIQEQGYTAIARPKGKADEMVIVSNSTSAIQTLDDLTKGCRIALADNHDVQLIGLRLLEAVDLTEADVEWDIMENYQAVARAILEGTADVAFFLAELYDSLSPMTVSKTKTLIKSDLHDITHVILVKDSPETQKFSEALLSLSADEEGEKILAELGMPKGFEAMSEEDSEFMIDLMETLRD